MIFKKEIPYILVLVGVIVVFFASKWILEGAFYLSDIFHTTAPLEDIFARSQKSGNFPLWSPELGGGYPVLGTPQLGFVYLPHVIFRQFLSGIGVINASLLFHSLLGGMGLYTLLRLNKLSPVAATAAAIIFPISGAMVGRYITANIFIVYAWLPLLLALIHLCITRKENRWLIWLIIAQSLTLLAGHQQIPLMMFPVQAIYALLVTYHHRNWKRLLVFIPAAIAIILVVIPHYLIVLNVVDRTDRAGQQDSENLLDFSFSSKAALGMIIPHPFGRDETQEAHPILGSQTTYNGPRNEIEVASYVGIGVVIATLLGLASKKHRNPLWQMSLIVLVVGVVLAPGKESPIYTWLVASGVQTYFNIPARFYLYIYLSLLIFAAYGLNKVKSKKIAILAALAVTIPPVWTGWYWHENEPWSTFETPEIVHWIKENLEKDNYRVFARTNLFNTQPDNNFQLTVWNPVRKGEIVKQTFYSPFPTLSGIAIKFSREHADDREIQLTLKDAANNTVRTSTLQQSEIKDSNWSIFSFDPVETPLDKKFIIEVTADKPKENAPLYLIHANPRLNYYPEGSLSLCKNDSCTEVKAGDNTIDLAFTPIEPNNARALSYRTISPSSSAGLGVNNAQWLGPLALQRTKTYLSDITTGDEQLDFKGSRSLIDRFSITHIISLIPANGAIETPHATQEVFSYPESSLLLKAYENSQAFPRIHFASEVIPGESSKPQRKIAEKLPPSPSTVAANIPQSKIYDATGSIETISSSDTHTVLQTRTQTESFLVIREVFNENWHIEVDGKEKELLLVDGLFRGVELPAGQHTVFMYYRQPLLNTYNTLVIILLLIGIWSSYEYLRERKNQSTVTAAT